MVGVRFVPVTEFSRTGTQLVKYIEKTGHKIAITKRGRPVALLRKATGAERGERKTISDIRNNAIITVSEIVDKRKQLVITRDGEPVAVLQPVAENEFSFDEPKGK